MDNHKRPKIGLALSGASGRAVAHIGVMEVLKENNIPIDYIAACSSGVMIAASYATGSMEILKQWLYSLSINKLLSLWSTKDAKGGIFHLHKADPQSEMITQGKTFEEVTPKLGFVAADINTGELINITSGDLLTAYKASTAVPGLFEPVIWNGRVLVDGGLVNIVPTKAVKDMGADIVIGVNIAARKFIYEKPLPIWKGYRFITRVLGLQYFREKFWKQFSSKIFFKFDSQSDMIKNDDIKIPSILTIITKALDHSLAISQQWKESDMACDLMIEPKVKHFGKTEFSNTERIYQEGRRSAQEAIVHIRKLIEDYGKKQ